jgi:hypothetical protein
LCSVPAAAATRAVVTRRRVAARAARLTSRTWAGAAAVVRASASRLAMSVPLHVLTRSALSVIEEDSAAARPNAPPRKMVTEGLRKSLTKQVHNPRGPNRPAVCVAVSHRAVAGLPHRRHPQRREALPVTSSPAPLLLWRPRASLRSTARCVAGGRRAC